MKFAYSNTSHLFKASEGFVFFVLSGANGGGLDAQQLTLYRYNPDTKSTGAIASAQIKPAIEKGFLYWSQSGEWNVVLDFFQSKEIPLWDAWGNDHPEAARSNTPVLGTPKESRYATSGMVYVASERQKAAWNELDAVFKQLPTFFSCKMGTYFYPEGNPVYPGSNPEAAQQFKIA